MWSISCHDHDTENTCSCIWHTALHTYLENLAGETLGQLMDRSCLSTDTHAYTQRISSWNTAIMTFYSMLIIHFNHIVGNLNSKGQHTVIIRHNYEHSYVKVIVRVKGIRWVCNFKTNIFLAEVEVIPDEFIVTENLFQLSRKQVCQS